MDGTRLLRNARVLTRMEYEFNICNCLKVYFDEYNNTANYSSCETSSETTTWAVCYNPVDGSRHLRTWYTKRTHLGDTGETLRTNIPPEKADGTLLINNLFVVNIFLCK
nr:uncharacterized protein LOC109620998 [Crassostrea gigas]